MSEILDKAIDIIARTDTVIKSLIVELNLKLVRIAQECHSDLHVDRYRFKKNKNDLFWTYYGIKLRNDRLILYIHRAGGICRDGGIRYHVYEFLVNPVEGGSRDTPGINATSR